MSIEKFLADQHKNKPRQFKDVVGKLLSEKEVVDTRPWKWEEEITEDDWLHMLDIQETSNSNREWLTYSFITAEIGQLDSSRMKAIDANTWNEIIAKINRKKTRALFERDTAQRIKENMHLVDPSRIESEPPKPDEIQDRMNRGHALHEWWSFTVDAAEWKKLYPEQKIDLNEKIWYEMRKIIENMRQRGQWDLFANFAARMRILAAHKVAITPKGLVITDLPHPELNSELPSRPIRKKI